MATPDRVVLVDGTAIIYRAWFALPKNLRTSFGLTTNAVFGFATMFRKLFAGRTPLYGAVIFDAPGRTFRDDKFPDYKSDRPRMDDDLKAQLPWIDRVVDVWGFPRLRVPGFEADDVIGTLARLAAARGDEVHIVSGDKDFCQLIDDDVRMLDTIRDITYDAELVRKKWGVTPGRFVDLLALMGDKIDNIPGVPGIGQKGAAGLLERFGDLETILASTDQLTGRQQTNLREFADQARLCQELATIDVHVPLEVTLDDLQLPAVDVAAVNALFLELEFYSLIDADEKDALASEGDYGTVWMAGGAAHTVEWLAEGATPVAIHPVFDVEDNAWTDLVGLAVSKEPGTGWYFPLLGPGDTLGAEGLALLRPWLEDPACPKVAYDWKKLWLGLRRAGIDARGCVFDVRLASFLIDPTNNIPHRLDQLVREFLHRTIKAGKNLVGAGKKLVPFAAVDSEEVTRWACHLADAVAAMLPVVRDRLEAEGHTAHLLEHDLPLSQILGAMEHLGIRADPNDLDLLGREFRERMNGHEQTVWSLAGREFNIKSTRQLGEVLFDELKLPVIKRTKTGYSTKEEVLLRLAGQGHDIATAVLEYRKMAKLINTYTDVLSAAVHPETGRIHATFGQTTGATGRLITTDPDLQRTPITTPEGRRIRQAFIPADGWRLISADWSQIELRILAHVSGDPALVEAFTNGWDIHARTAAGLFGVHRDEVTRAQRDVGKTVNFATIYGQGATALGQILGVDRGQAASWIDAYFVTYAGVRRWLDATMATAMETGYVETLLGRRRYIPELSSNNVMDRETGKRMAANTPIQGSAADLCKEVMLVLPKRFAEAGLQTRMLLQIHDELVFEALEDEVARSCTIVRDCMESSVRLDVPLIVDVGVGMSWSEAH